jgi:pimeloyl-ACP methyl ester carboxylesterase
MLAFPDKSPAPRLIRTAAGDIEVAEWGEGPPVLALHGGMGGHDQSTLLARALFPDGVHVIAVSRPGYLGTPLETARSPAAHAELYAAVLDELRVQRCLVAAVSAGGPSALAFANEHPARCAGLILVSACTGRLAIPEQVRRRLPMIKLFARVPGLSRFMRWRNARNPERAARRSITDPALAARILADPEIGPLFRSLLSSMFDRLAERLPGTFNDMSHFAVMEDSPVDRIAAPILSIHGNADRVVPFAQAERIAAQAPNASLLRIAGGEHVSLFTHMYDIRARVRDFLKH